MRIATYNVEWFNSLFDDDGALIGGGSWSSRRDVTKAQQTQAVGHVFRAMDADAIMVIEAPDTSRQRDGVRALEGFARQFDLRARRALMGFANDTQQEITLLYDPDVLSARHDPQASTAAPGFNTEFAIDLDIDAEADVVSFSKPPLEVAVETAAGFAFRMIGVHAKSKAPHGARSPDEVMRLSIANRRKQLAQCIWLRARVSAHLEAGDPMIVLGDFNDGPGLDEYEKLFGRSSVEIVLGEGDSALFDPHARAALTQRIGAVPTSSRFFLAHENRYLQALLDYIMVSPELRQMQPNWRIWHPFEDAGCFHMPELREALLTASDHFPVTLDLQL
ncbi:MAG: endonuclease/exonuclease/phosphatase family protein [Pseudomonadota bacterium]